MKKLTLLVTGIAGLMLLAMLTPALAAEQGDGKEVTISGEAKCAMCALKQTEKCQTVIETADKDGKKVTYWVTDNKVAKDFHSKVCKGPQKVTATGKVKKAENKSEFTLSKIEVK